MSEFRLFMIKEGVTDGSPLILLPIRLTFAVSFNESVSLELTYTALIDQSGLHKNRYEFLYTVRMVHLHL